MPSVFKSIGGLHLRVTEIELVGAGALAQQFEMLKKKLAAEGLFDALRKRTLPRFPERIGLITSSGAAAYDDVLRVLQNRWGGLEIQFYPVSVQGFGAVESIVEAFGYFNRVAPTPSNLPSGRGGKMRAGEEKFSPPLGGGGRGGQGVDVIILTRGGGSLEDLQAFNSELVARAVFGSRSPVVCGVGHERDITIADLVADIRAATPSNAAEIVVPDRREIMEHIIWSTEHLERGMRVAMEERIGIIDKAMEMIDRFVDERGVRVDMVIAGLRRHVAIYSEKLSQKKDMIGYLVRTLNNLNPLHILKRGYSVVYKEGKVIKTGQDIGKDDIVEVQLYKGGFRGRVLEQNI